MISFCRFSNLYDPPFRPKTCPPATNPIRTGAGVRSSGRGFS
jgi:hypothetical protein